MYTCKYYLHSHNSEFKKVYNFYRNRKNKRNRIPLPWQRTICLSLFGTPRSVRLSIGLPRFGITNGHLSKGDVDNNYVKSSRDRSQKWRSGVAWWDAITSPRKAESTRRERFSRFPRILICTYVCVATINHPLPLYD